MPETIAGTTVPDSALVRDTTTLVQQAAAVGLSPRHVARLVAAEMGISPVRLVERIRLDPAKVLLDAGHSIAETARAAGFGSTETLRRVFVARFGVAPSRYRARFFATSIKEQDFWTVPSRGGRGRGVVHARPVQRGWPEAP